MVNLIWFQIFAHKEKHKFLEIGQGNQEIPDKADWPEEREFKLGQ